MTLISCTHEKEAFTNHEKGSERCPTQEFSKTPITSITPSISNHNIKYS